MLLQRIVSENVVVNKRVFLWTEVPWLLLWVVGAVLQTREFILEVQYIVRLLVSQCPILVLGQHVDELVLLLLPGLALESRVLVHLSDGIVTGLLLLHSLGCNLVISWCYSLEFLLLLSIVVYLTLPRGVFGLSCEENFI